MSERYSESSESNSKLFISYKWWIVDQSRGNTFIVHANNPSHALNVITDNYDIDLSKNRKKTSISSCSDNNQSSLNKQFPDQVIISDLTTQHQSAVDRLRKSETSKTDNDQPKPFRPFALIGRWLLD